MKYNAWLYRCLEAVYPHFPSEQELTHHILSSGDLQQLSGEKFSLLVRFIMDHPQFYIGGILLPDLVELYQWLHMNYAHMLTYERASSITIGKMINLAEKNLSRDLGNHVRKLYDRVMLNYNQYMELIGGAAGRGKNIISNDTHLLKLITGKY